MQFSTKPDLGFSFSDDKDVISHYGNFVGKGLPKLNLFILDIAYEIMNTNVSNSTCIAKTIDLWHDRSC